MQVLWLEDDFVEVFFVVKKLVNFGFKIFQATNIEIAERLLAERQFDLVVLDSFLNKHGHEGATGEHVGIHLGRRIQNGEFGPWGATVNIMFLTSYRDAVLRQLEKEHFGKSKVFSKNESQTTFFQEVTQMSETNRSNGTHIHVVGDAHFGDVVNTGHGAVVAGHNASSKVSNEGISVEDWVALEKALAGQREYFAAEKVRELADASEEERPSKVSAFRTWFGGAATTVKEAIYSAAEGLKIWDKVSSFLSD